jgi:foldase protein PrsA
MRTLKLLIPLGLLLGLGSSVFAQVDPNRLVATVNGEEIKGAEYYRRMEYLPGVGRQNGQAFAEFPPGFLTIEALITERLVLQLARQKGVLPSDQDVQNEFAARNADNPDILVAWQQSGRTVDELKRQILIELAQFRVATFGVTITDQQIEDYYAKNPSTFTTPKRYKLRVIVLKEQKKKAEVDADLGAGKSFGETAAKYSDDISRVNGGVYGTIPEDFLSDTVKDALKGVKIGKSTDWLELTLSDGSKDAVKFYLEDILPETKTPLDTKLKRALRQRLMAEEGKKVNNVAKDMAALRAKAKIDIKQPEFADVYKKFIEGYLKQQLGGN